MFVSYDDIYRVDISVGYSNVCVSHRTWLTPRSIDYTNRLVCSGKDLDTVMYKVGHRILQPDKNTKLYISKGCSTPRSLIRNDYTIVRDKNAADFIVIPEIGKYMNSVRLMEDVTSNKCNVLFKSNNNLFLVRFRFASPYPSFLIDHKEDVEKYINSHFENPEYLTVDNRHVYFVKPCEELNEILGAPSNLAKKYIFESKLGFNSPMKINLETLDIWASMKDKGMLEKMIFNSNWQEYPFTLCLFFDVANRLYAVESTGAKLIHKVIKFSEFIDGDYGDISPEDWDMAQSFLFHYILKVDEDTGMTNYDSLESVPKRYKWMINHRIAVKKKHISEQKTLEEIRLELNQN